MKKFEVTPGFVLLMSYLTFHDEMFIMFILATALHELAHIAVTLLLGGNLLSCRLSLAGACIKTGRLSYDREAIAVAAGPAVNLIAAFITSRLDLYMLAGVNLSLGLLNILPARELDGGRLVEIFFSRRGNPANGVLCILTIISSVVLAVPLGIGFVNGITNYTLAIFVSFLLIGEIYGQFTHARTKARALYGRRNWKCFKRVVKD